MFAETVLVIVVGLIGGYWMSIRFSGHATAMQSAIQLLVATVWVAAAIITIATGFYIMGAIMLMLFSFFWLSNYRTVRDSDLRQKTSSWNPFGFQPK